MSANGDIDIGLLVPELIDLDISELDDAEYNIPPIDKTPTLESILNDDEGSLISEEELPQYLSQEHISSTFDDKFETGSVSSVGSRTSHTSKSTQSAGSVLRHVVLRNISSNLLAAQEKTNCGLPSVMCVGSVIAVGTSHGLVYCFDANQRARWEHDAEREREQGAVTCLTLNTESTRLLVGYARGAVVMMDTNDGKVLRFISPEAHTPFTAVVHLKFTDSPSLALLSDSGGSVFEIGLKRVLGVRSWDCKCIFSGSRGEVVVMEPLLLHNLLSHPLAGSVIVAMATLSKVLLVSLRPQTRLLFTQSLKSDPTSLPLLSWQFVVIQVADSSRVMDPVLAFARHDAIYFYQVSLDMTGRIACHGLQMINLTYSLLSCHWLTSRTLALVDSSEVLHLVDVRSKQELEMQDLSPVALVYNSSAFKGIATGGNVSKAMALAGERACYNTIQSFGSQLLLLGTKSVHVISIRLWSERIESLVLENRLSEALKLARDFYEDRGKAVLGLRGPKEQRHNIVRQKVVEVLELYITTVIDNPDCINVHDSIPILIEHCLDLGLRDLLFDKLWNKLEEGSDVFLDGISTALLEGKITDPPPEVMQNLVHHLTSQERWKELEDCILRADVFCLDIDQVSTVCKQHNLYAALISVWNRAMGDFTSPLHELVPVLQQQLSDKEADSRPLGNLLLVYVSSCLGGRGGLGGLSLSSDRMEYARQQVCRALCSQHSHTDVDSQLPFPYIRTLLEFDTKEFLNALVIAFSDTSMPMQVKQRLVDIIVQVMVESDSFSCTQVGWLLCLLHGPTCRGIRIDGQLCQDALTRLLTESQPSIAERQQTALDLLSCGALKQFSPDSLIELSFSAQFYEVCSLLHQEQGKYDQVLHCILLDPLKKKTVFDYIDQSPHKDKMKITTPSKVKALMELDPHKTGFTFGKHFTPSLVDIVGELDGEDLYHFLCGFQEACPLGTELMTKLVCLMCKYDPDNVLSFVKSHNNIELNTAVAVSKEEGLFEVTALLLERGGQFQEAFDLLLLELEKAIERGDPVERRTEELVNLARRGNAVLDSSTSWLPLLTCLLRLNSHELLQRVLSDTELNLASELHLLMQHTRGTLGDLRNLIMGLFVKCRHQRRMVEAIRKLNMSDLHRELSIAINGARRGVKVPPLCNTCSLSFSDKLCLFRCGHGYHTDCAPPSGKCVTCFK